MKTPRDATCAPNERISQRADARRAASSRHVAHAGCLVGAALLAACNLNNPGLAPPEGVISFPVSVALSTESKPNYLFVTSSNFDLRYNAGSVQSYDLRLLDDVIARGGCRAREVKRVSLDGGIVTVPDGTRSATSMDAGGVATDAGFPAVDDAGIADAGVAAPDAGAGAIALPPDYTATSDYGNARGVLCDGRDAHEDAGTGTEVDNPCCVSGDRLAALRPPGRSSLSIDSFATAMAIAPDGRHLYVPVSSRSILLDIDVAQDGTMSCGEDVGRCRRGPGFRRTDDDPEADFPGQPAALTVGKLRDLGITEAIGTGADGRPTGKTPDTTYVASAHELGGVGLFVAGQDGRLTLESVLENAAPRGNARVVRPTSIVAAPTQNLLYVTAAGQATISRLGVRVDGDSVDGEQAPRELLYLTDLIGVAGLADARDLRDVVIDPSHPSRLYALVRGLQESVAFLELEPGNLNGVRVVDAVRVGSGPSKLAHIQVGGRGYLLVSCYDARTIFIIDVAERAMVAMVRNLSGPFQMAFDGGRNLLHVADFRASVVRVVDLSWLADKRQPPPRIIATLGTPRFEGGLE